METIKQQPKSSVSMPKNRVRAPSEQPIRSYQSISFTALRNKKEHHFIVPWQLENENESY